MGHSNLSSNNIWLFFAIITLPLDIFLMGAYMSSDKIVLFILFEIIGFFISLLITYLFLKTIYKLLGKNLK